MNSEQGCAVILAGGSGSSMCNVLDMSKIQGLRWQVKNFHMHGSLRTCEDCLLGMTV